MGIVSNSKKVVVITGASSGIGEALAKVAAQLNYNIVIAARKLDQLQRVQAECEALGAKVLSLKVDVCVESECAILMENAIQTFGRIDVLINNAGISMRAMFKDCDLNVIKQVMDVNFWGTVYCTKFALPHLLKQKGTVVGVSSIAGIKGLPARTGYSASKFAMHGFLESLRIEHLKTGLKVLLACPGYTASNIRNAALNQHGNSQTESPYDESKLMPAEAVAKAIFKAVHKEKAYLYLSTQGKLTLWLNKFFPIWLDRLVYKTVAKEKDSPFK